MYHNYTFEDVNHALPHLLSELQDGPGKEVGSRAGRTMEMTHIGITLTNPLNREVLVPGRRASIAAQIAETMWVLSGRDDIVWLANYLPRVYEFSDDGERWRAGYGRRLRSWAGDMQIVDQLDYVVKTLRSSALTRQAVMSIWDPTIDTRPGKDIPCNDWITFSNRDGKLDMHVGIRSNDIIWGWSGINQFEWSTLLEIVAAMVGVQVGSLHFSTTSFHIYEHHWAKARQIREEAFGTQTLVLPRQSPRFQASVPDVKGLDVLFRRWFAVEEQIRTGSVPQSELDRAIHEFPEPMLQSWLRVIRWWWTGNRNHLGPYLVGTPLEQATYVSVQPKQLHIDNAKIANVKFDRSKWETWKPMGASTFITEACKLHLEKDAAYGDSWKRRGEMLGILANIARKVDRLGRGETSDETSADTAMDLMIYLAKYNTWLKSLFGQDPTLKKLSDDPTQANDVLFEVDNMGDKVLRDQQATEDYLRKAFDDLEQLVNRGDRREVRQLVDDMLSEAYRLARFLWEKENDHPVMTDAASVGGGLPGSWTDEYRGADHD